MDELIVRLTSLCSTSVSIEWNPHRILYEDAETYLTNAALGVFEGTDLTKDIWVVQAYPRTPVVSYSIVGNDLKTLLQEIIAALEEYK